MMRLLARLPGPPPVRIATAILVGIVLVAALFYLYDWLGTTFLDTGGTIG